MYNANWPAEAVTDKTAVVVDTIVVVIVLATTGAAVVFLAVVSVVATVAEDDSSKKYKWMFMKEKLLILEIWKSGSWLNFCVKKRYLLIFNQNFKNSESFIKKLFVLYTAWTKSGTHCGTYE